MFVCFLAIVGCRDDNSGLLYPYHEGDINYSDEFELFWQRMNYDYTFWDVDPTDWDSIYAVYRPKFVALNVKYYSTQNPDSIAKGDSIAIEYYKEMTKNIVDGHYSLTFNNDKTYYPRRYQHPELSTPRLWVDFRSYFFDNCKKYLTGKCPVSGYGDYGIDTTLDITMEIYQDTSFVVISGLIPTDDGGIIPYFFLSNFHIYILHYTSQSLHNFLGYLIKAPNVRGIIFDVRGNGGGFTEDIKQMFPPFINSPDDFDKPYIKQKSGNGRLDYTPWVYDRDFYTFRHRVEYGQQCDKPMVILTDFSSASCSEWMTTQVKHRPKGLQVGKTTWGAYGPIYADTFHKGWRVLQSMRFASYQVKFASDAASPEGQGRVPDYDVNLDTNLYKVGTDTQLEKAIAVIKEKQ